MSDFARWVREGGKVKLACSAEFANAGTLRSLEQTYGFHLEPRQKIVLAGGETAATIGAAAARTNGINTAMVYGTDGGIVAADLVLLEDDSKTSPSTRRCRSCARACCGRGRRSPTSCGR